MAKVEQRMEESDKRWEKRMANIEQRVDESDKRWEKRMAKVEQRMDGSDKRFKEEHKYWNKRWGDLARTLGRIAEDMSLPISQDWLNITLVASSWMILWCGANIGIQQFPNSVNLT
jgi:hypothetical protein